MTVSDESNDLVSERQRLLESLILDGTRCLWVAEEYVDQISRVLGQMPLRDLRRLSELEFWFLAPDRLFGRTTRMGHSVHQGERIVFLSPELLGEQQQDISAVIAHELAHVLLGHEEEASPDARPEAENSERDADALIRDWGFQLSSRLFDRK